MRKGRGVIMYIKRMILIAAVMVFTTGIITVGYGYWTDRLDLEGSAHVRLELDVIDDIADSIPTPPAMCLTEAPTASEAQQVSDEQISENSGAAETGDQNNDSSISDDSNTDNDNPTDESNADNNNSSDESNADNTATEDLNTTTDNDNNTDDSNADPDAENSDAQTTTDTENASDGTDPSDGGSNT